MSVLCGRRVQDPRPSFLSNLAPPKREESAVDLKPVRGLDNPELQKPESDRFVVRRPFPDAYHYNWRQRKVMAIDRVLTRRASGETDAPFPLDAPYAFEEQPIIDWVAVMICPHITRPLPPCTLHRLIILFRQTTKHERRQIVGLAVVGPK